MSDGSAGGLLRPDGRNGARQPVLITGGAGFVGTNLAAQLLAIGRPVRVLDDLSRPGVVRNLRWLRERHAPLLDVRIGDVRNREQVRAAVAGTSWVVHLAAQVAVTTSLRDPLADHAVNVGGTLHVLEALRALHAPPPLLFTSTNKVYGALADLSLECAPQRWHAPVGSGAEFGISEARPLDLHSPYGCSKGSADQYVLDYARCFGLSAVVFRMSCVYGPHQCGNEDQGWVAHLLDRALRDAPITIYGDGRQVRDLLHVDDLVDAMLGAWLLARERPGGHVFNIGGGPGNTVSLREVLARIEALLGRPPRVRWAEPRMGDQRYYASDLRAFSRATGWWPATAVDAGIEGLARWLAQQRLGDQPLPAAPLRAAPLSR